MYAEKKREEKSICIRSVNWKVQEPQKDLIIQQIGRLKS